MRHALLPKGNGASREVVGDVLRVEVREPLIPRHVDPPRDVVLSPKTSLPEVELPKRRLGGLVAPPGTVAGLDFVPAWGESPTPNGSVLD